MTRIIKLKTLYKKNCVVQSYENKIIKDKIKKK